MNNINDVDNIPLTIEFLMLSDYEFERDANNYSTRISNSLKSEEYLEQFYNHFFLFKKVLDDPGLDEIKTSTEAIANMSKANQKTRDELNGYVRTFYKWIDQVLVPLVKNTQRLAVSMARVVRDQNVRTKLENSYKTTDLRVDDYKQYFNDLCEVLTASSQAIEKVQNVSDNKDVVDVQSATSNIDERTSSIMTRVNEFNNKKASEENKVEPENGQWFSGSYLSQLANVMNRVLSTCLNLKRNRSTIIQILNAMETTSDSQTRKINKVKLEAVNSIVHDQLKSNFTAISVNATYVGQKLQQMYKMTLPRATSTKSQVPTKDESETV